MAVCVSTHLSTEGGAEAAVQSQNTFSLHHTHGHSHHPHPHLVLCLEVHLEENRYQKPGSDTVERSQCKVLVLLFKNE